MSVSLSLYDRYKLRAADDDGQGERAPYPGECRECDAEPCPRHASRAENRRLGRRFDGRYARACRLRKP